MRGKSYAIAAGLLAGLLAASVVLAEDIWVKSESAEIRAGKGGFRAPGYSAEGREARQ